MRLIANENISGTVIRSLRQRGHDVLSVKESMRVPATGPFWLGLKPSNESSSRTTRILASWHFDSASQPALA